MNHTPGPWRIEKNRAPNGSSYYRIYDKDEAHNVIAQVIGDGRVEYHENAQYIVHACNAHEELVVALRGMIDLMDNKPTSYEEDQQISKYRQVLNAIEKGA